MPLVCQEVMTYVDYNDYHKLLVFGDRAAKGTPKNISINGLIAGFTFAQKWMLRHFVLTVLMDFLFDRFLFHCLLCGSCDFLLGSLCWCFLFTAGFVASLRHSLCKQTSHTH